MPSENDLTGMLSAVRIHRGTTTSASTFVETETVALPDGRYETRFVYPRSSNVVVSEINWEEEAELGESYIPPPRMTSEEFHERFRERIVGSTFSDYIKEKPRIDIPEIDDKDQISF